MSKEYTQEAVTITDEQSPEVTGPDDAETTPVESEEVVELEQDEQDGQEEQEGKEDAVDEEPAEKKLELTQAEVDDIVKKRLVRERRRIAREQAEAEDNLPPLKIESKLKPDDFATTEDYIDALANEKADAKLAQQKAANESKRIVSEYEKQVDDIIDKYPDYEDVVSNEDLKISAPMRDAIFTSEVGAEVAYHLGTHPEEAERISKLAPVRQIAEIVKLETTLSVKLAEPKQKGKKAPDPINPIAKPKGKVRTQDTTDPRSINDMSTSEWIKQDRLRRYNKLKAQGLN